MTLIPVLATTFKVPKARPPRPETGTGSGGATGCGYATVFTDYECLTLHHRILPCQVWARVGSGFLMHPCQGRMQFRKIGGRNNVGLFSKW